MITDVLVSQVNQLLGASYQPYRNSETSDTISARSAMRPRGSARTHSNCRTNDILRLQANDAAGTTQALPRSSTGAGAVGVGEARDDAGEPRR